MPYRISTDLQGRYGHPFLRVERIRMPCRSMVAMYQTFAAQKRKHGLRLSAEGPIA